MTRAADVKESTGVFDNALVVSGAFAMRWNPGAALDAAAAVVAEADNVQLLLAEASMDESPGSEALKDESPHLALELHRIELKLNVLLKIAGELLAREHRLPAPRLGRLSATGLECAVDDTYKVGDRGILELFVNRSLPYALRFNARIDAQRMHEGVRMAHFRFEEVSEPLSDHMAKLIFRKHRRLIAIAKNA
jgi:hypothetical protein